MINKKAEKYAKSVIESFGTNGVPCGVSDIKRMITEGFIAGATWYKTNRWIPVKDGSGRPKDGMPVLVRRHYRNKYGQFTTRVTQELFFEEFGFDTFCSKHCNERITHWMPVPQP